VSGGGTGRSEESTRAKTRANESSKNRSHLGRPVPLWTGSPAESAWALCSAFKSARSALLFAREIVDVLEREVTP